MIESVVSQLKYRGIASTMTEGGDKRVVVVGAGDTSSAPEFMCTSLTLH